MDQDPDSPPTFWFQPPPATNRRRTPPVDPVVLIILIPILALILLFFILPPFLAHTSHILKPGSVKSTWDSLNIFLVLFAILCGVLARQNDETAQSSSKSSSSQFSDQKGFSTGLRRNSSSYPNLRHESVWENAENHRNRYFDDFNVDLYSSPAPRYYDNRRPGDLQRRSRPREADQVEIFDEKEIVVDTVATPPPPPPPPPPTASFRSVGKNVKVDVQLKAEEIRRPLHSEALDQSRSYPSPPPPPPPQSAASEVRMRRSRNKHKKLERKVSDATKEIASAISSLYNHRKRKNKRKLSNNININNNSGTVPPPPPPPPPPSSIFNNIFKVGKSKRFNSPTTPPPPPPPPQPPSSIIKTEAINATKSKRFNKISTTFSKVPPPPPPPPMTPPRHTVSVKSKRISKKSQPQPEPQNHHSTSKRKPPLPTKTSSYYDRDEFLPSGSQSPLIPMPPPPPPFKMSAMKFELRGDFVRIRSSHSSVCSSPDRDDIEFSSTVTNSGNSAFHSAGPSSVSGTRPSFFPSPDVNAKAESFITRLKDEWRMDQKKNYGKEKMG
ncbi:uncharacterized protein LOC143585927 [Bidens hawaiensis]|uniref:uncharacterized protein LOC143585927 n=1 Tax=Bidens hawaiensis TaxID=980011 RepID=UPI00404A8458